MFRRLGGTLVLGVGAMLATLAGAAHEVPLFPSAADPDRQGFVRIINHAARSGSIRLFAIDDDGNRVGPLEVPIGANEAIHINSNDLEAGNPAKGLVTGTGSGSGDWRLVLETGLDIEVLAYVRTGAGFLASMHELVGVNSDGLYSLGLFDPSGDGDPSGLLRLVNPGEDAIDARITATDDEGNDSGEVIVTVSAGASRTLTAEQLRTGAMLDGALGDGAGKWRLFVSADAPMTVLNLMEGPDRQLVNLAGASSKVDEAGTHHVALFPGAADGAGREGLVRVVNRSGRSGIGWYRRHGPFGRQPGNRRSGCRDQQGGSVGRR